MLRGSREDMLDGKPRPCGKRYIAGYEPEYEECRLKFRENSRHADSSITLPVNSHRKPLPKTLASPDFFFLVPQPAHKYPSIEHLPKPHPAAIHRNKRPCGPPIPSSVPARRAGLRSSGSPLSKRARAPTLECVSSSSTEKTRRRSRDVDHLAAQ